MCGICGIYAFSKIDDPAGRIGPMMAAMNHRGPDDEGHFTVQSRQSDDQLPFSCCLGHKRLSIIDLSAAGRQPLSNENRRIWMVFNGEIYNFRELRKNLIERGHRFRSETDCEVVIHLYEDEGPSMIEKLRGMFAFALLDLSKGSLLLCRDRFGIKPLYYHYDGKTLYFASEIKSLLVNREIPRALDPEALDVFLTLGFVPAPKTMFRNIRKVLPGRYVIFTPGDREEYIYWDMGEKMALGDRKRNRDEAEATRILDFLLQRAVVSHSVSDVPVGVFLSGGLDSSAITAYLSRFGEEKVKTFSVGFASAEGFNEVAQAREIAAAFKTEHRELILDTGDMAVLPKVIWHQEEPLMDPAAIALYHLSSLASREVKVVLTGEGGDEIFGGYPRYYWHKKSCQMGKIPAWLKQYTLYPFSTALSRWHGGPLGKIFRRMGKFVDGERRDEGDRYAVWFSIFEKELKNEIFRQPGLLEKKGNCQAGHIFRDYLDVFPGKDPVTRAQFLDLNTYLADDLLLKADKITSAFSLEGRVPFLDHRLFDYTGSLPAGMKMSGGTTKYILRNCLKNFIPESIRKGRKKGFMIPIQSWLANGHRDMVCDLLLSPGSLARDLCHITGLQSLVRDLDLGLFHSAEKIYSLLSLEIWHRLFFKGESSSAVMSSWRGTNENNIY